MKVLLIEDDPLIAQAVKSSLIDDAYVVETATNGTDALSLIALQEYGFILLDLGLPGIDGMTVLKSLRGSPKKETPVIIMTARDGLNDRLEGLDAGADDYLVKPFHMSELLARMRAVLRRKAQSVVNTLSNGVVTLNIQEKTAKIVDSDETVALSKREYALLAALLARPGAILSKRTLEERIYEPGEEPESNAVEYLIHSLRKKLGSATIKNVRGLGWMVAKGHL
ncbi:MAG TPA: response regulator transcription factor [Candidatus Aphodousia faecipullorum]|nr:response regulator transcription factor [Candidatus Aphodousia faecipullorum]